LDTLSASSKLAVSLAWSCALTAVPAQRFQMPSATASLLAVLPFSLKSPGRYCVIQWLEERGSCIVKSHNLPYWLMTDEVKQKLITQGVAVFARAICAMLRCHERRKGAVALLQKCPAIAKVSSTSVSLLWALASALACDSPTSPVTHAAVDGLHTRCVFCSFSQNIFRLPEQRRAIPGISP